MEFEHIPVLLKESIEGLAIHDGGIYVDCTVGGAGHSSEILKRIKSNGHLYGFDQDAVAIETARARLSKISPQFTLIHTNFRNMKQELKARGIRKVDGIYSTWASLLINLIMVIEDLVTITMLYLI
jgi:16S rRNA (cytosine1402-N4)-methyltransferase